MTTARRGPEQTARTAPFIVVSPLQSDILPYWIVELLQSLLHKWAVPSATLLYWTTTQALMPFIGLHLHDVGASSTMVGVVLATYPLASLVLAVPLGRQLDRLDARPCLVASLLAMAASGAMFVAATDPVAFLPIMFAWGTASLVAWLALQMLIADAGRSARGTRVISGFSIAWGVGIALGPTVGAAIFDRGKHARPR